MNPRYLHEFFGHRIGLSRGDKSREGGLKRPFDLEKWKTLVFSYSNLKPNLSKREETIW